MNEPSTARTLINGKTTRRIEGLLFSLASSIFLTGCNNDIYYHPPANMSQPAAEIVGSLTKVPGVMSSDVQALCTRIDNKPATGFYDTPVPVEPGIHHLELYAKQGEEWSYTPLDFKFEPGKTYVVHATATSHGAALIWITNDTGEILTAKIRAATERAYDPAVPFGVLPISGSK